MEGQTLTWVSTLLSWAPFLLLLGILFWIYFKRKMGGGREAKYIERSQAFMDRQEQLLERIAIADEGRSDAYGSIIVGQGHRER